MPNKTVDRDALNVALSALCEIVTLMKKRNAGVSQHRLEGATFMKEVIRRHVNALDHLYSAATEELRHVGGLIQDAREALQGSQDGDQP